MKTVKDWIGESLIGKRVRFRCECLVSMDVTGECVGYEVRHNEVVWKMRTDGKYIEIGENHPKLEIEII